MTQWPPRLVYRVARFSEAGDFYVNLPGEYSTFTDAAAKAGHYKSQRPAVRYVVTENGNVCYDMPQPPDLGP